MGVCRMGALAPFVAMIAHGAARRDPQDGASHFLECVAPFLNDKQDGANRRRPCRLGIVAGAPFSNDK
jgi:hypothetical protein